MNEEWEEKEVANTFKISQYCDIMHAAMPKYNDFYDPDLSPVVNSVIHSVTAKYPQALYTPGYSFFFKAMKSLYWLGAGDYFSFQQTKELKEMLEL